MHLARAQMSLNQSEHYPKEKPNFNLTKKMQFSFLHFVLFMKRTNFF